MASGACPILSSKRRADRHPLQGWNSIERFPTLRPVHNRCVFSPDRLHRYTLEHICNPLFDDGRRAAFIGLNPSTADENDLDPTLRRIRSFCEREGLGGFIMLNLFAFRSTDPKRMLAAEDPVGPENDRWIESVCRSAHLVVAAWGNHGSHQNRDLHVARMLGHAGVTLRCLGTNANGSPKHPLYVPGNARLVTWIPSGY